MVGQNYRGPDSVYGKICNLWDDKPYPWCYVSGDSCVDASGRKPQKEFYENHELRFGVCQIIYGRDDCDDNVCSQNGLCIDLIEDTR